MNKSALISKLAKISLTMYLGTTFILSVNATTKDDFMVDPNVTIFTGDRWEQDNKTYQLYGVQASLRGYFYENFKQIKIDSGQVSSQILGSFFKDVNVWCRPILDVETVTFVVCKFNIKQDVVDLGTALILLGYHFTAIDLKESLPINFTYLAAENEARASKTGLWAFDMFPHPVIILKNLRNSK